MFGFGRKKNNRSEQIKTSITNYSVFVTDEFTKEDAEFMRPIFTIIHNENKYKESIVLCYALDEDGELDLDDAKELIISNIDKLLKSNVGMEFTVHYEALKEDEKAVIKSFEEFLRD